MKKKTIIVKILLGVPIINGGVVAFYFWIGNFEKYQENSIYLVIGMVALAVWHLTD